MQDFKSICIWTVSHSLFLRYKSGRIMDNDSRSPNPTKIEYPGLYVEVTG